MAWIARPHVSQWLSLCAQADVLGLKRAMSQTKQTMMVTVAVAVDANPFYTDCLAAYLNDLPGAITSVPAAEEMRSNLQLLRGAQVGLQSVQELTHMYGLLPSIQAGLRRESHQLKQLREELLCETKGPIKASLHHKFDGDEIVLMKGLMELVAEALLYFPDDEILVDNQTCIVDRVQSGAQKASERSLTAICHKITVLFQAADIDGAAMLELLDEFNRSHVGQPIAKTLESETTSLFKKSAMLLLSDVEKLWPSEDIQQNVSSLVQWLESVGGSISVPLVSKSALAMKESFHIYKLKQKMETAQGSNEAIHLEFLLEFKRGHLKFHRSLVEMVDATKDTDMAKTAGQAMFKLFKTTAENMKKVAQGHKVQAENAMNDALDALHSLLEKVKVWNDKKGSAALVELKAVAKDTLLTIQPDAFMSASTTLTEAWEKYTNALSVAGGDANEQKKKAMRNALHEASVLKLIGCIMRALTQTEHKDAKLRSVITPHAKELRTLVGKEKEKEVMGEAVYTKVQQIVSMRPDSG
eukprot:6492582-Amphidinium_carterae.3